MTNLDSILKSRDITLPTKVRLVKAMVFPVVMCGCESWTVKKVERWKIDAFELWCWRRLLRVLGLQGNPTSPSQRRPVLGVHWKDWCWSWNSNTFATSCEELTHWRRPWCWEGLGQEEKGTTDDKMPGWHHWLDGYEFWVNSRSLWWTGSLGMLPFMGSQRVRHYWATELNWMLK